MIVITNSFMAVQVSRYAAEKPSNFANSINHCILTISGLLQKNEGILEFLANGLSKLDNIHYFSFPANHP